jgi:hypothetical protein
MLEDAEYHGPQGIGWLSLMTPDQVPAFEKRIRAQGGPMPVSRCIPAPNPRACWSRR